MRIACLVLLLSAPAFGQEMNDPTGKVFTSLADYTVNRDKVMKKCVFFAVAEIHMLRKGDEPEVTQHFLTALFDHNRLLTYRANGTFGMPERPWMQTWQEWLEHAGQTKSRVRLWNWGNNEYHKQKVGEKQLDFMQKSSGSFSFVDPISSEPTRLLISFKSRTTLRSTSWRTEN